MLALCSKNNLEDGTYTYYVWINDSAGNSNQTETYTLTKDSTPPSLFLVSPFDNRWNSSSLIKFEYNVSDNIMGVNNCSLVMNIIDKASDGTLTGCSTALYKQILASFPGLKLIASGGVSSVNDIEELKSINITGVIIGKAIYENKVTLKQLSRYAS